MLNGPPGSINNAFGDDFTVVSHQKPVGVRPRSLVISNRTLLNAVFNHAEETVQVYCNYPADSP
jgi:chitinase